MPIAQGTATGGLHKLVAVFEPVPYTASTTTCQALWTGVPVVTLAGRHFHERMGASVLVHAGLEELVAASEDEYVAVAARLAGDRPRLRELRTGLRSRLRDSRLCDEQAFVAQLEDTYRELWQKTLEKRTAGKWYPRASRSDPS